MRGRWACLLIITRRKAAIINCLFIVVSRIYMKTRDEVIIDSYWLKFFNVDCEENNKFHTLKYKRRKKDRKRKNPAKNIMQ